MSNVGVDRARTTRSIEWLPRSAVAAAINPHLLQVLKIEAQHETERLAAHALVSPRRLDTMAKYVYALHRTMGIPSAWGTHVYREHLRVWNQFREGDASGKCSFEDYQQSFDRLLESVAETGFDETMGLLPVDRNDTIIDGAHRLAAALARRSAVRVVRFDALAANYDHDYFKQRGLAVEVLDEMVLQYCRLDAGVRVAVLFPVARGHDEEVLRLLREQGAIVYRKAVTLTRNGRANLIRLLYRSEPWLGDGTKPTPGLLHHVNNRFVDYLPVNFVFFTGGDAAAHRDAKHRIRALFAIGNDSIHINDSHEQTTAIAESVLNANSLHFVNAARPVVLKHFSELFERYRNWIAREKLDAQRFCIDGSAVLSAYGLRDANDLDYLYAGSAAPTSPDALISCHNGELAHYRMDVGDLVMDPRNHFFWNGVKFVALHRLREMKARRAEPKDISDVYRIDTLEGRIGLVGRLFRWYYTLPERLYSLRYGVLRAAKRIIPAPLLPAARAVYRLPQTVRGWIGPEQRTALYRGFELHYSKGTSLVESIQDGRTYEPEVTQRLVAALDVANSGLFLDIGANIGLITLNVLAERPGVLVVAFEPGTHQAGLLERTVASNRLGDRVTVLRSALSHREGTARFAVHRSRHASGDGFLDTRRAGKTHTVEVPVTTVDSWWRGAGRPHVSAIKVDTEGAELWILQGGSEMLAACHPLVVFELHPKNIRVYPYEPIDILRFFHPLGYSVRTIAGIQIAEDNLGQYLETTNDYVAEVAQERVRDQGE